MSQPRVAHDAQTVERFHPVVGHADGAFGPRAVGLMRQNPEGEWVRYTDYAALEARVAAAKRATRIVQNAAKQIVAGADRRVEVATKHEPAARVAIATLESEREMNARLTEELAEAESRLATLQKEHERIMQKIRALKEAHDRDAVANEYFDVLAEAK